MCYQGCPYERWSGECGGFKSLNKGQPYCADEDEYLDALVTRDDMLCDRQDYDEARQHGF